MTRKLALAFWIAYTALLAVIIVSLPLNRYEWMLEVPAMQAEGMNLCSLPIDDDSDVAIVTALSLIPMLIVSLILAVRQRKLHYSFWLNILLVTFWGLRFLVFLPSCP